MRAALGIRRMMRRRFYLLLAIAFLTSAPNRAVSFASSDDSPKGAEAAKPSTEARPASGKSFRIRRLSVDAQQNYDRLSRACADASKHGDDDTVRFLLTSMLAIFRSELPEDHPLIRKNSSQLIMHDWYLALSPEDRTESDEAWKLSQDALYLVSVDKFEEAMSKLDRAGASFSRLGVPQSLHMVDFSRTQARCFAEMGRPVEAIAAWRSACEVAVVFGSDYSDTHARCLRELAVGLESRGELVESARAIHKACRIFLAYGEDDPLGPEEYARTLLEAETGLETLGDWKRASRCLDEVSKVIERVPEKQEPLTIRLLHSRVRLCLEAGENESARKLIEEYLTLSRQTNGLTEGLTIRGELIKADILLRLGRKEEAEGVVARVRRVFAERPSVPFARAIGVEQLRYLRNFGRENDLMELLKSDLNHDERRMGTESPGLVRILNDYSIALRKAGQENEARKIDARVAKINENIQEMRRKIEADPECKFPWEE